MAIPFRVVQGTEAKIINKGYNEGYLYFATDTKKIYLDANGQSKLPMGGNSGIYYGRMVLAETPDEGQKEFDFTPLDLEVNLNSDSISLPNIGDLILNIPDGCFYRVTEVDGTDEEAIISTEKLTIAGSGGSGGGSGGAESLAGLIYNRITPQYVDTLKDYACNIEFEVKATDTSGENTGPGVYRVRVGGIEKARGVANNGTKTVVNVGPYLTIGENKVEIYVDMDTGGSSVTTSKKTWVVKATNINLVWDYNTTTINKTTELFKLEWTITGGAGIEKTTNIFIDNIPMPLDKTTGTGLRSMEIDPTAYGFGHGVHKIEMFVSATVGTDYLETDVITKNAVFAEEGNTNYIINCNYFKNTATQYDTIKLPIFIYSEANITSNATVTLRENGSVKDTWYNMANGEIRDWAYTPINSGLQILSIQCGTSEYILQLDVESLGIEIEETSGYAFKFKASEFASNNSIKEWRGGTNKNIGISFSEKFDWINGGLKTEEDEHKNPRQYVCVKAGSTMTIDYNIFGIDARQNGKCFKVIFKAAKCKDYDAQVLSCHDGRRGLVLNAQNARFNSTDISLNIPYCEDSYIELELDITPNRGGTKQLYVRPWIDGVPAGVKAYETTDLFATNSDNKLVIGSNDCDVYIYLIKMYESHLPDTNHLNNFIADAPNASEMLARFRRNDILDENDEISPTRLAEANPNCRVHMYEMSRMTMHKKDKIKDCKYTQYHGDGKTATLAADGVTVKVQGTSSAAYGLAAFNLDSEFENGFTDIKNDEQHIDKWSMNENSIPVNYFCTKVNVASAESANNALNQEWYNRFQPYKTVVRGKNEKARDTMEFTPGVLFIWDRNPQTNDTENGGKGDNVFKDTLGYCDTTTPDGKLLTSGYYKMYSVCNMGNSKDNIEVFHDTENPYECCVENGDNQLPGQWMVTPQGGYKIGDTFVAVNLPLPIRDANGVITSRGIDDDKFTLCPDGQTRSNRNLWETGMDEIYGFRYPDGIEEVKELDTVYAEKMIVGWYDFVSWMAESNPAEKYQIIKFIDIYESKEYETEEDFIKDESTKYIFNTETEEYVPVIEYIDNTTTYYLLNSAANQFNARNFNLYTIDENDINRVHNLVTTDAIYDEDLTYYRETAHIYGATNEKLPEPKTFNAYKFKGYKAPGDLAQYQADYTPVVNPSYPDSKDGWSISTYAGTYEYDTYEYRMAKMLSECEQHLCMDSILFHYLFIERHSMVDNVAKNTFWSTEDCQVWNLTKDYDNDTADGNNNQGKLELTYGCEPGDVDAGGTSIFNAGNSVWLKFISGLYPIVQRMYNHLESQGAWSPTAYLSLFDEWQSAIPERCWIEDYYRKYIRPYEVYNTTMFLEMHEGGKKTYQRKQYETYQNYYISSKYFGSTCKTNKFTTRPNGNNLSNFTIPITLYADCYVHGAFGSGTDNPNFTQRCKRNTTIYMTSPIDDATDATTYLYPANLYQTLGNKDSGLNQLKLEQFESEGSATKLRILALGVYNVDIDNTSLGSIGIAGCENLEELYVARMKNPGLAALNLTHTKGIKKVDARDSAFTTISIADNAPLISLLVHNPQTLSLSNLTDLEILDIQKKDALEQVLINNIDNSRVNSKNNIVDIVPRLQNYKLTNVQWLINQATVNGVPEIDTANHTIRVLERLRALRPYTDESGFTTPVSASLTGTLTVASNVYNSADSIKIYNTYAQSYSYPNLDIKFEGSEAIIPMVTIYDGNDETCWSRRIVKGAQMDEAFLQEGPFGPFNISVITKQSSVSADYVFENKWEVYDENGQIDTINGQQPIYAKAINKDIIIKPVFKEQIRQYELMFYTYNPDTNKVDLPMLAQPLKVNWGTLLTDVLPKEIPYKPEDASYGLKEANNFIGYGLVPRATTPAAADYTVNNNQDFYAIFERVPDITKVVHPEYFDFHYYQYSADTSYTEDGSDPSFGNKIGVSVSPKAGVTLQGKITIPSYTTTYIRGEQTVTGDKMPVLAIADYFACEYNGSPGGIPKGHKITHIFTEADSQLLEIGRWAFASNDIEYFDFSANTVRFIGASAFKFCQKLHNVSLSSNIFYIGDAAFNGSMCNKVTSLVIPGSVHSIGSVGFCYLKVAPGCNLTIGSQEEPSRLNLRRISGVSQQNDGWKKFVSNADNRWGRIEFYTRNYNTGGDVIDPAVPEISVTNTFGYYDNLDIHHIS